MTWTAPQADLTGYAANRTAQLDHRNVRQQIAVDKPALRGLIHVQPQQGADLWRDRRSNGRNAHAGKRDGVPMDCANQASERIGQPVLHARPDTACNHKQGVRSQVTAPWQLAIHSFAYLPGRLRCRNATRPRRSLSTPNHARIGGAGGKVASSATAAAEQPAWRRPQRPFRAFCPEMRVSGRRRRGGRHGGRRGVAAADRRLPAA